MAPLVRENLGAKPEQVLVLERLGEGILQLPP